MPLMDFNQEETWNLLYSSEIDGVTKHFERVAKQQYFGDDGQLLLETINPEKTQRIIIIGGAFGWIAEDWISQGYNVIVTDTSAWIQQNKNSNAIVDILNLDCLTTEGKASIGNGDIIISEDVMPCLSNEECIALSESMHQLAPRVYHWVSVGPGFVNLNWKQLEEWKASLSNDYFIKRGTKDIV